MFCCTALELVLLRLVGNTGIAHLSDDTAGRLELVVLDTLGMKRDDLFSVCYAAPQLAFISRRQVQIN